MAERTVVEYGPESFVIASFIALSHLRYPHRYPQMVAVTPPFRRYGNPRSEFVLHLGRYFAPSRLTAFIFRIWIFHGVTVLMGLVPIHAVRAGLSADGNRLYSLRESSIALAHALTGNQPVTGSIDAD